MLNLAEYRKKSTSLCDYLPWACLVGSGVVLNKDGSFQRTIRYRGPDLDSATEAELVSVAARLNNVLKRFGAGWALFFEAARIPANQYPGARFADPFGESRGDLLQPRLVVLDVAQVPQRLRLRQVVDQFELQAVELVEDEAVPREPGGGQCVLERPSDGGR